MKAKDLIRALRKVDPEAEMCYDDALIGVLVSASGTIVRQYTNPNGGTIAVLEPDPDAELPFQYWVNDGGHKIIKRNG